MAGRCNGDRKEKVKWESERVQERGFEPTTSRIEGVRSIWESRKERDGDGASCKLMTSGALRCREGQGKRKGRARVSESGN